MPPAFRSSLLRRILLWLLVGLLPLQGLAAGTIAARGPAHTHLPTASTRLLLDDFRRTPVRRGAVDAHAAAGFGHDHEGAITERHRHAPSDPTVVVDTAERLQVDEADDMSVSPSLGFFAGLISTAPRWPFDTTAARVTSPPRWQPQTHHPALPERPPRALA